MSKQNANGAAKSHHHHHHRGTKRHRSGGGSDRRSNVSYIPTIEESKRGGSTRAKKKQKSEFSCSEEPRNRSVLDWDFVHMLEKPETPDHLYAYAVARLSTQVPLKYWFEKDIPMMYFETKSKDNAIPHASDKQFIDGFSDRPALAMNMRTHKADTLGVSRPKGTMARQNVTWLRRTRFIGAESQSLKKRRREVAPTSSPLSDVKAMSIEDQCDMIEESFNVSTKRPVNQADSSVRPVTVLHLQPHEEMARVMASVVTFDTSPAQAILNRRSASDGRRCSSATDIEKARELVSDIVLSEHSNKTFGVYVPTIESVPLLPTALRLTRDDAKILVPEFDWDDDKCYDNGTQLVPIPSEVGATKTRVAFEWVKEYVVSADKIERPLTFFSLSDTSARYGQYTGRMRLRKRGQSDDLQDPIDLRPSMLVFNS